MTERASVDTVVQELSDKQAITEVLFSYCAFLDKMDLDALAALFTEDCTVDYGPEPRLRSSGAAGLRRDLARMWRWSRTSHHLSNVLVTLDPGRAGARALSYVLAWHERPDGSTATMMGQYEDRLVLGADGRWRIASRRQLLTGNDAGFDVGINRFERLGRPPSA
ncbi:MAG: nuclear transport factor 2 family protein [Actinomycetota bacterium]|nr:nuclear transport factor 2 family protein [Actinomycetota bacterium]